MKQNLTKLAAVIVIAATSACGSSTETANPQSFTRGPNAPSFDVATGVLSSAGREIGRTGDQVIEANGRARVTRNAAQTTRVAQARTSDAYALSYATYRGSSDRSGVIGDDLRKFWLWFNFTY